MVATTERNGHSRIPNPSQSSRPSPHQGRTADGRFAADNPGGPGNPYTRKSARHRSVMCDGLSDQDFLDLTQTLLLHAKQGNMTAARLLLQYTIGKPGEAKDPDRVDQDEWELLKDRQKHSLKEMNDTLEGFPLSVILGLTKALTQILEDTLHDKFIALGQKPDDSSSAPPRPPVPPRPTPPAPHEDLAGRIRGTKMAPEAGPNQRPAECVTPPIEPGKVGAVGTTCPSSQKSKSEPNSPRDKGKIEAGLDPVDNVTAYGIPDQVRKNPRFQKLLSELQSYYDLLLQQGSQPQNLNTVRPTERNSSPQEAIKPHRSADARSGRPGGLPPQG